MLYTVTITGLPGGPLSITSDERTRIKVGVGGVVNELPPTGMITTDPIALQFVALDGTSFGARVTVTSGNVTVPTNVVTYNGEPVTYLGEYVTYTP